MADFRDTRDTLFRKPNIQFVEPDQVLGEPAPAEPEVATIDDARARTATLIDQYKRIEDLSCIAQERIDKRASGVKICMNPVTDTATIESIKRLFGTTEPCVTYTMYKACLDRVAVAGRDATPTLKLEDMVAAAADPFRKDFGGFGGPDGALRPDLQIQSPIKPVDLEKFQKQQVIKLFQMMFPLISGLGDFKIATHTAELPGHFK